MIAMQSSVIIDLQLIYVYSLLCPSLQAKKVKPPPPKVVEEESSEEDSSEEEEMQVKSIETTVLPIIKWLAILWFVI